MRRPVLTTVALSIGTNIAAAMWGRGSFAHLIIVMMASIYVGPALAIAGTGLWLLRRRFPRARQLAIGAWIIAAIACSSALSLVAGSRLASRDVAEAKVYCEALASRLDEHKRTTGAYPATLAPLRQDTEGPRIVRESLSYASDGTGFQLTFLDPRGLLNGWSYRSVDRRWVEWD